MKTTLTTPKTAAGVALLLTFAMITASPAHAQVEKILFASTANGDYDIWMVNPDGSELEVLIDEPADQWMPKVSPDGTRVAYISNEGGAFSVRILDLTTWMVSIVPIPQNILYAWLPDGSGFVTAVGASCQGDLHYLYFDGTLTLLHAEARRQNVYGVNPATGEIFFESDPCSSPSMVIKALDPSTGTIRVVQGADGRSEGSGDISLDGSFFAYAKADWSYYDPHRIHVMSTGGSGERQVSRDEGVGDHNPSFSPDGSMIAFARKMSSTDHDLVVVDFDGIEEVVILDDAFAAIQPEWASLRLCSFGPEGQPIVFFRDTGKPIVETFEWESCGGSGTLRITNDSISSAWVWLNGEIIATPSDFNENVITLEFYVELAEGINILEAQLASEPGRSLSFEFFEN